MFSRWLEDHGAAPPLAAVTRQDVDGFLAHVHATRKPATANMRFRGLKRLFGWLAAEEEIPANPMANIKPPRFKLAPPKPLTEADVLRLLATCKGTGFEERRDAAIINLLVDTGLRRGELENLKLADVDLYKSRTAQVDGKSGPRFIPLGSKTAAVMDRYFRARSLHPAAAREPWLWLGKKGRLTGDGVRQMIERRAAQAGLQGVFVHLFRHTFAHMWLAGGGGEGNLMKIAGWESHTMVLRYGAGAAAERALASHAEFSPRDRMKG
jgi:site-specific recombinase XerD